VHFCIFFGFNTAGNNVHLRNEMMWGGNALATIKARKFDHMTASVENFT